MYLMYSVTTGLVARGTSFASDTHFNQECWCKRFVRFFKKCGLEKDPLLTKFSISQQNAIMLDFAQLIRCNEHGKTTKSTLLVGTFKAAIGYVAKTFRENFRKDPIRDAKNKRFSSIPTVIRG